MTKNRLPWLMVLALGMGLLLWLDQAGTDGIAPRAGGQVVLSLPSENPSHGLAVAASSLTDSNATRFDGQAKNPLADLDVEVLRAMVERPLFTPSRRPPPMPETVVVPQSSIPAPLAPASPPPSYILLGVIRDGDRAIALLRGREDGRNIRVEAGDVIGGWEISAVQQASVSLRRQDGALHEIPLTR
jgi:hypothetical protein